MFTLLFNIVFFTNIFVCIHAATQDTVFMLHFLIYTFCYIREQFGQIDSLICNEYLKFILDPEMQINRSLQLTKHYILTQFRVDFFRFLCISFPKLNLLCLVLGPYNWYFVLIRWLLSYLFLSLNFELYLNTLIIYFKIAACNAVTFIEKCVVLPQNVIW